MGVALSGGVAQAQEWNSPGLAQSDAARASEPPPAARARDLTGIWDAGAAGIAGPGQTSAPLTTAGQRLLVDIRPGNGPRAVPEEQINDPLSIMCDPMGFPRQLLYELRPFQVVQTPDAVLMLYMFEKRWRVVWTDGRPLPTNPDPRWYGYSVGRWEDDQNFVVTTVGTDPRTWLDNAGNPHSADLKVTERYRLVNRDLVELTVTIDDPAVYTRPWRGRDALPLRRVSAKTDFMEMICSPTETAAYKKLVDEQNAKRR